eukprot:c17751_g2_i1 orf=535-1479(-)
MQALILAKKQKFQHLWCTCSELVAKSGLTQEALTKHLPLDLVRDIVDLRLQRAYPLQMTNGRDNRPLEEQRIRRMQQALDSLDVELVRLMVLGEGLNLDKSHALHYAVAGCSREVVKALLELGAVDVNYPSRGGRTALHIAAEMANPEMIALLLDHHASPQVVADDGASPLDILQALAVETSSAARKVGLSKLDHRNVCLSLELLQSAVVIASKEEQSRTPLMIDNRSCMPMTAISSNKGNSLVETEESTSQPLSSGRLPMATSCALDPDSYPMPIWNQIKAPTNGSLEALLFSIESDHLQIAGLSENPSSVLV